MSVKTEIMDNLINIISNIKKEDGSNLFKKVKRGIVVIEDVKKNDYPICVINSTKIEHDSALSGFTRQARKLFVEMLAIDKHNKSDLYFDIGDYIEDLLIETLECLLPSDVHSNVLGIDFLSSEPIINDNYINGLVVIKIMVVITYRI